MEVPMNQSGLTETMTFNCGKITGDGDIDKVETALGAVDGVRRVAVDTNGHCVTVEYDPTIVDTNLIRERLGAGGYAVAAGA
jgi:copper chaperone CopZ